MWLAERMGGIKRCDIKVVMLIFTANIMVKVYSGVGQSMLADDTTLGIVVIT